MPNASSTGGYLAPESTALVDDIDLDALIQPIIVGITGLPDGQVLIKGQGVPPSQPARTMTWCAFAVTTTTPDINASYAHDGAADGGLGATTEIRNEDLEVTASFYGPASRQYAAILRDGFGIGQNRETMRAEGLAYVGMQRVTFVPDLENTQRVRRADLVFRIRRFALRTYPIRNVVSVEGTITADRQNVSTSFAEGP